MRLRRFSALGAVAAALGVLGIATPAAAQLDAAALVRALGQGGSTTAHWPSTFINASGGKVSLLVRRPISGFDGVTLPSDQVPALIAAHPDWQFDWSPGRHLLMDRAQIWTGAASYRQTTGGTGRGVIVGIVDSGVDVTHPDLRDAAGKSRVLRMLDFSRGPLGTEPALEDAYDCTSKRDCAILTGDDIDALIANSVVGDEPQDDVGHGTHVASLAAGGGRADPRYVGIAPEASFIAARVTGADGTVQDENILRAVRFVFEQADQLGMPAVVNLSLGSDFGGHDGVSSLEQGLAAFVTDDRPGHGIVVAAGNSAGLLRNLTPDYPAPFGIHTEVHVPRQSSVRIPILSPPVGYTTTRATIYAWLTFRPGDDVSVGLDKPLIEPISPGRAGSVEEGKLRAAVYNGDSAPNLQIEQRNAAVVVIDGEWSAGSVFALRLEGHGAAEIWLQSEGALAPEVAGIGAVVPRASKEGTINVPATAPELIAVGASTNRVEWQDVDGESVKFTDNGALDVSPLDSIAYFSAAGPNAVGSIKPDIVAPGNYVIGAMSSLADPRLTSGGMFSGTGRCSPFGDNCFVVSDRYAVAAGTSMATPIVSGAIALLFEHDPTLTQARARRLLQAGARRLQGVVFEPTQAGPGALDLVGTERALAGAPSVARLPDAGASWLTVSSPLIRPDPNWTLDGLVTLRDSQGLPADGFGASRLDLQVRGAKLSGALTRIEAGLWSFQLAGLPRTGQGTARVTLNFDGRTLLNRTLSVGVDHAVAAEGVLVRGGCAVVVSDGVGADGWAFVLVGAIAFGASARVRRHSRAR